ncbi:MAG: AraC family transcriptional regulator [Thermomicrobiales bacterium]
MKPGVAVFRTADHRYYADTCVPLRQAVERDEVRLVARVHGAYPGEPLAPGRLTEVRSVGYWDADHDQSWGLDWHRNEGIELTYLASGKVGFAVDDKICHLKSGDLTVTRPWQMHRVGNPDVTACRLHWLILDVGVRRPNQPWKWPSWLVLSAEDLASLTINLSHNEQPVWPADDEVAHYFKRLGEATAAYDDRTGESRLKLHINGLLIAVADLLRRSQPLLDPSLSSTQRTVELFLSSLPDHVDQDWTVASMAAACGLGRSRFTHYCKQITNMSPNEFLARCRVEAASRLLQCRLDLNITAVALRTGFGSSQYFSTVFRQHVGCSPREFRR